MTETGAQQPLPSAVCVKCRNILTTEAALKNIDHYNALKHLEDSSSRCKLCKVILDGIYTSDRGEAPLLLKGNAEIGVIIPERNGVGLKITLTVVRESRSPFMLRRELVILSDNGSISRCRYLIIANSS